MESSQLCCSSATQGCLEVILLRACASYFVGVQGGCHVVGRLACCAVCLTEDSHMGCPEVVGLVCVQMASIACRSTSRAVQSVQPFCIRETQGT
jgi:hypothetical protein